MDDQLKDVVKQEKHPPGLYVLFFTEMWERFGFYSMLAMFTLYLKDPKDGFGWTAAEATTLYSNYLLFVYASPLVGGWIADRGLGYRNSVLIGGLIFIVGYSLFALHTVPGVYAALACLVVANGFFKPNVSAMVGHLYPEGSALKDRAYNIFYMGINIGAFFAPVIAEYTHTEFGFAKAFLVAAGGMVISVSILWIFKHTVDAPKVSKELLDDAAAPLSAEPLSPATVRRPIDDVPDGMRIGALIVIFLIVIVFWMVFHQNGSTLTYWADDNTDWKVSGIISNAINPFWVVTLTFPLVWFWGWLNKHGLEPATPTKIALGMLLTAASFGILYAAARMGEDQHYNPTLKSNLHADFRVNERALENLKSEGVPEDVIAKLRAKDSEGKYIVLGKKFAERELHIGTESGQHQLSDALNKVLGPEDGKRYGDAIFSNSYLFKVSPLWLIIAYAVVTLGELMLSPMGLSLVSKVAPIRFRGLMMGGWFVATAIGNKLTAIGVYWDIWLQSSFFGVLACMSLVMACVLLLLLKPLRKAMPGA